MPREPEVAAESRSPGSRPMCGEGGPVPLGVPLQGGMPLGVGPGPGEVSSAMWWRRLTSSAAMAAAPSLSLRCSTCTHSQILLGNKHDLQICQPMLGPISECPLAVAL